MFHILRGKPDTFVFCVGEGQIFSVQLYNYYNFFFKKRIFAEVYPCTDYYMQKLDFNSQVKLKYAHYFDVKHSALKQ